MAVWMLHSVPGRHGSKKAEFLSPRCFTKCLEHAENSAENTWGLFILQNTQPNGLFSTAGLVDD